MLHISLSSPGAPSVSDLLQDIPLFARLPEDGVDCLRHLQQACAERYQAGEWMTLGEEILVLCAGELELVLCCANRRMVRFRSPSLVLRFDQSDVRQLSRCCPAVWKSFEQASALIGLDECGDKPDDNL